MDRNVKVMLAREVVCRAIINTRNYFQQDWKKLLDEKMCCKEKMAGRYAQFMNHEQMENALKSARWEETTHVLVPQGRRVFVAQLPGFTKYFPIYSGASENVYKAQKNEDGEFYLTTEYSKIPKSDIYLVEELRTYFIVGLRDGIEVCMNFYPGEPVALTKKKVENFYPGIPMTKVKAEHYGFEWAKIV